MLLQPNLSLKTNFTIRAITLAVIIIGVLLLVNMLVLGVAKFYGVEITNREDLLTILDGGQNIAIAKMIVGLNHFLTFIVGPMIFLLVFYRNSIWNYLQLRHFNPQYIILFPLALFFLLPLMGFITFYIAQIEFPTFLDNMDADATETLTKLLKMEGPTDLMINLMLIGILPGIGEELLFRGIIQKEIYQKWNKPHLAIWSTAILFSAFHFQVVGFLPKMMIGAVLGYAYYYSGSLILPMIVHTINNGFATVSYYMAGEDIEAEKIPEVNVPISAVLISTLIFLMIAHYIKSISLPSNTKGDE